MSKTLEVEQISEYISPLGGLAYSYDMEDKFAAIVATAKAGAHLASMCRGAIKGCDENTDPAGRIKAMLTQFLLVAGFDE